MPGEDPTQPGGRDAFGLNMIPPSFLENDVDSERIDAYKRWVNSGRRAGRLVYSSFSGADIQCAVQVPSANQLDGAATVTPPGKAAGSFKVMAQIQTLTISSERPPGPVRTLGFAAPRDYVRGVRTIAGSLIFTVFDKDVWSELMQPSDKEGMSEFPLFVDEIPSFNIIVKAVNELGISATAAIIGVTLTNFGKTFSIDDLMLETTYTYVAQYVWPFRPDSQDWRNELASGLSRRFGAQDGMTPLSSFASKLQRTEFRNMAGR